MMASIHRLGWGVLATLCVVVAADRCQAEGSAPVTLDTGYRGIWYSNQKVDTEYVYKYSGGLGTYCAKHIPMAVYRPEVHKTFFVYGGTKPGANTLLIMVSYYDNATGTVPRPTVLLDKETTDAHDNPVIAVDDDGYVWVFASAHGKSRPAYIFKSRRPYAVDAFELVLETNFSYPQPWHVPGKGFLFFHTSYDGGRVLYWQTSGDGRTWSPRSRLAFIDEGHYQISWPHGDLSGRPRTDAKVGTAFNYHPTAFQDDPARKGLNWRTNLYYVETDDMGATWRNVQGDVVQTPMTEADNPALVHDYQAEGRLVYLKDLNYDAAGRPVILHVTAANWEPGAPGEPRTWRVAHWNGDTWTLDTITHSDNNYDTGCLHIGPDGTWRVIGPTETGPQRYNPGGEVAVWESADQGRTWAKTVQVTKDSPFNHTYVRRPLDAHPTFYAFWADGHGRRPSASRLYFWDQSRRRAFRLPATMTGDAATPEQLE